MAIDPKLPIPVYFQLKTLLLEEILEGRYGPDGRLPTEHQLCERHEISRTPVTRALSELAAEGVVIRHRRRGTFVNPHWVRGHREGPELRVIVPADSSVDAVADLVEPGGIVVLDDFAPCEMWPPISYGRVDWLREQWLSDERFTAVEVMVAADASAVIATRR